MAVKIASAVATDEAEHLEVLLDQIAKYESKHHALKFADQEHQVPIAQLTRVLLPACLGPTIFTIRLVCNASATLLAR